MFGSKELDSLPKSRGLAKKTTHPHQKLLTWFVTDINKENVHKRCVFMLA